MVASAGRAIPIVLPINPFLDYRRTRQAEQIVLPITPFLDYRCTRQADRVTYKSFPRLATVLGQADRVTYKSVLRHHEHHAPSTNGL